MAVGGAVASSSQWHDLEASWGRLLSRSKVPAYHWKEFHDPNDKIFGQWGRLKRDRFVAAQNKIIQKNTMFRVFVGVDGKMHTTVKQRMKGISGFHAESDYSLALRWLMFFICEQLVTIDRDARLAVLVEDGPWSSGAAHTYQRVSRMTSGRRPAKHAHRLAGFASAPKGERMSLEAADYIVGSVAQQIARQTEHVKADRLSVMLTEPELELWYKMMMAEKESRRLHWKTNRSSP